MSLIGFSNLSAGFGDNVLFENASFDVYEKETVGVIGANGVGKTTLFRIITGECDDYTGEVIKQKDAVVGYMQQHACDGSELCVYDEALTVFENLKKIEIRLEEISRQIDSEGADEKVLEEQLFLNEKYQAEDGLSYKNRTRAALMGLGFTKEDLNLPVKNLSGGQRSKLALCKLLLSKCDLMLLDEPTNHLDIESVEWLEDFIRDFKGACMIISHDRFFLDKLTSKTVEIENRRITVRKGNYSRNAELKKFELEAQKRNYENTMAQVHRIEGIIAQQKQWNRQRNIKTAESKQKMIDRMTKDLAEPQEMQEKISFGFEQKIESGNDVLFAEGLSKSFDGKTLFKNVDLDVKKGDRLFFLGANGSGKTTLLKILVGKEEADSGYYRFGTNVKIGYFDQTLEGLNSNKTAFEEVYDSNRQMNVTQIRNAMARFSFKGEDVNKKMDELSGGERAKIALLKLMLKGANVLILDEPTNHLDINSREALEEALEKFEGTLIAVSHDRYFINKLSETIIRIDENTAEKFDGKYDDYRRIITERESGKTVVVEKPAVNDYKLRKEQESRKRKLTTQITKTEQEIETTEKELSEAEDELQLSGGSADYETLMELTQKIATLKEKVELLMEKWEQLNEEKSTFEQS